MSYTKQNFKDGQTLTADHLNHIEDGIATAADGCGVLVVHVNYDGNESTIDKTYAEMRAAILAGQFVVISRHYAEGGYMSTNYFTDVELSEDSSYPEDNCIRWGYGAITFRPDGTMEQGGNG